LIANHTLEIVNSGQKVSALVLMVAATLLGATPRGMAADPSGLAPRFSATGWLGIVQASPGPIRPQ
jgi:hypothetical protein